MQRKLFFVSFLLAYFGIVSASMGDQTLYAKRITEPPVIDGISSDSAWDDAQEITTLDTTSKLPITLKAVYTDTELFILVNFPDPDESRTHKSWTWDKGRAMYTVGHDREDIFVIKWSMEPSPVDLSIFADNPYMADIWFWKACRTDPAGYADDKSHIFSEVEERDSTEITTRSGKTMFLLRKGDAGDSAYRIDLASDFKGQTLPRFLSQHPSNSRGDVKAKGVWRNNTWTIEFRRNIVTGNSDDLQFNRGGKFLFGVSRHEIAGRDINLKLSDPMYGAGDVSEPLWLEFLQ